MLMATPMTDYRAIYETRADDYDRMVEVEDVDGEVIGSLAALAPLSGSNVCEVGIGTGRITRQLVARGARVFGVEPAEAMLRIAISKVRALGGDASGLVSGSLGALPFGDATADLGVAGWVFGHQRTFEPQTWRSEVGRGVAELERVVRPGGAIALFETHGTGVEAPLFVDGADGREDFYELLRFLVEDLGFERRILRTDYRLSSPEEAARALEFFFGPEMGARIRARGWARVPEWTGLYTKRVGR